MIKKYKNNINIQIKKATQINPISWYIVDTAIDISSDISNIIYKGINNIIITWYIFICYIFNKKKASANTDTFEIHKNKQKKMKKIKTENGENWIILLSSA